MEDKVETTQKIRKWKSEAALLDANLSFLEQKSHIPRSDVNLPKKTSPRHLASPRKTEPYIDNPSLNTPKDVAFFEKFNTVPIVTDQKVTKQPLQKSWSWAVGYTPPPPTKDNQFSFYDISRTSHNALPADSSSVEDSIQVLRRNTQHLTVIPEDATEEPTTTITTPDPINIL